MRRRKSRRRLCGCWSGEAGTFRTQTTDPLFELSAAEGSSCLWLMDVSAILKMV